MLIGISILKALLEVAALTLLSQGLLYLLAGARRERNVVYQAMGTVTRPLIWLARGLTPRRLILDQHVGFVAFLLVALGWYVVVLEKQTLCMGRLTESACLPMVEGVAERCADGQAEACAILERNGLPSQPQEGGAVVP